MDNGTHYDKTIAMKSIEERVTALETNLLTLANAIYAMIQNTMGTELPKPPPRLPFEPMEPPSPAPHFNLDLGMGEGCTGAQKEELDYEVPTFQLQRLLRGDWFAEVRTSECYDAAWTDAFVEALMNSEFGEQIARDWAVQGKRERKAQVKGHVVGLLKDAGVLKGSYGSIARKVGIIVNEENKKDPYKTFADYMARGKKQPYAGWVKEYVEKTEEVFGRG